MAIPLPDMPEASQRKDGSMEANTGNGARAVVMHARGRKRGIFWVTPDAPQSTAFRGLGREQPIVCLRAPPLANRAAPPTLEQLARYYCDTVERFPQHEPVTLVGYCIAGVLAREIAIELQQRGRSVGALIMIDPPDAAKSRAPLHVDPTSYRYAQQARRWAFHLRSLVALGGREMIAYGVSSVRGVISRLRYRKSRAAYAAASSGSAALPDEYSDSYHISVAAFLNATPRSYSGSACIIRPTAVPHRVFEHANRRWRELIVGGVQIEAVAGDSTTMWREPAVQTLSKTILGLLESSTVLNDGVET